MSYSNFFLPLTGKEDTKRLEVKYGAFCESDEEEEVGKKSQVKGGKGKISEWTIDDKPTTSQWLRSPSKTDSECAANHWKTHPSQNRRARRNLLSPKNSRVQKSKDEGISPSSEVNSDKNLHRHGEVGIKQDRKAASSNCDYHIDDSTDDSDNDNESNAGSKSESTKRVDVSHKMPAKATFISEDFSVEDTERPKLSVRPSAGKVDFQLSPDGEQPVVKVPACMNQYLRDYQRDGIKFLYQHYVQGKGAILGDDMGLGKTVQVIGFLSALLGKQGNHKDTVRALPRFIREFSDEITNSPPRAANNPFLIVGPACVMMNWLEEFITWGYFSTGKFHGGDKENCLADVRKGKLEVVVTTFETFRDNVDILCDIEWEGVIVDEVHKMKEPKAQVSKALNQLTTMRRFGLTGTALQNHMVDLWSILDWAQPGILGSLEKFNHKFTFAIEAGQRHDANKRDLALARKQKDKFAEIRKRILLRRTKALIADQLPSKEDNVVMCRLTDFQVSVYKAILNHPHTRLILQAEDPCDCGRKKLKASCCYKYAPGTKVKVWSLVLSFMHLLLKAANHCALLMPDSGGKTSQCQAKLAREVCQEALKDFPQFVQQTRDAAFLTLSDPRYCGKMKILQGLLSVFSSSHDKVLLFSYSTRLLDIIEQYVIGQCYEYRRIDGKTSSQKRMEIVHQFNKDSDIFLCLISTKAGGLGLNLTGANRVVIFDPNWNPSHDLQAQDRAYRIGQTRNVKVYRLVSAGTIEENIYLRQIYKQQLDEVAVSTSNAKRYFHGVQGDKWSRGELFGVKNMFSLRTSDTCLTMDILKRNERLEKDLSSYDITRYIPPSVEGDSLDDNRDDDDDSPGDTVDDSREDKEEEEEEDDILLESLFGKDRTFGRDSGTQSAATSRLTAPCNDEETVASVESGRDSNDSSGEDGDFLIPKLRHTSKSKKMKDSSQSQSSDTDKDLFTIDEITFPRSTCCTVKTQRNPENVSRAKCRLNNWKPSPGLSWLFSSDDEGDKIDEEGSKIEDKDFAERNENDKVQKQLGLKNTESMLARLFPDSEDEALNDHEGDETCHGEDKEHEKETKQRPRINTSPSKRKVRIVDKATENQPFTSGVRQSKRKATKDSRQGSEASKSDSDSVKKVFEECGVLHIHGNRDVIGSSRAEDHMTRCAMQEVFEMKTNTQMPAMQCDPLPQDAEEEPKSKKRKGKKDPPDHNAPSSTKVGSAKLLLGQTPPGVQRQMWADLCKFTKEDQLALAQRIVASSTEERLEMLRAFYTNKHQKLGDTLDSLLRIKSTDDTVTSIKERQPREIKPSTTSSATRKRVGASSSSKPTRSKGIVAPTNKPSPHTATSSKSKRPIRRPLPPTLTGLTFLDSESQDSLTAHSHPAHPSLSPDDEEENEKFSPAPPKQKPRHFSPSSKSTTTTRVRQKALNEAARVKLFKKPSDRKGVAYDGNDDDDDDDDGFSVSCIDGNGVTDRLNLYVTQTTEDIPSLLCEMGGASMRLQQRQSRSSKSATKTMTCVDHTTSKDEIISETEVYNISTTSMTSFQTKCSNNSKKRQNNNNTRRRDYASILDDIFDDQTVDVNEDVCRERKQFEQVVCNTNADLSTEKLESNSKLGIVPDLTSTCNDNNNRPSTSTSACNTNTRREQNPRNSPLCEVEGSVEMEVLEVGADSDEADCLFLTSTLKEDGPKSPRRRGKSQHASPGKGNRRKKGFSPRKRMEMEMEVMDDVHGQSQSLFS